MEDERPKGRHYVPDSETVKQTRPDKPLSQTRERFDRAGLLAIRPFCDGRELRC
jgi:hypothetical protein